MKFRIYTFIAFFPLVLIFAVWSNAQIYAQSPATGGMASKSISPEVKSILCDPSNSDLKVVNTTEARICGIPKTVKQSLLAAPEISTATSPSSSPPAQQTATTGAKPITPTSITISPKPQQTVTSKNINANSPSTIYVTWATISLLSNTSSSSLPSSTIAPQIAAVSQQQSPPLIPIARVNSTIGTNNTAGQNHLFAATSPIATSDKLIYLGYHDTTATPSSSTHGNTGSKDKGNQNNKPPTHSSSTSSTNDSSPPKKVKRSSSISPDTESSTPPHSRIIVTYNNNSPQTTKTKLTKTHSSSDSSSIKTDKSSTTTDSGYTGKKKITKTSATNSDSTPYYTTGDSGPTKKVKRSSSISPDSRSLINGNTNNHVIDSSSLASDLGSAIRDKVHSIIRDSLGESGHSLFGFSDIGGF